MACDYAFSAEGGTKSETEGLVTVALRGGTDIEITVEAGAYTRPLSAQLEPFLTQNIP